MNSIPEKEQKLVAEALKAAQNAYAPYSKFYVGSALETMKGNIFVGCNVENASYGITNCAERTAIFTAIAQEGSAMVIKTIVALCQNQEGILLDGCCCGLCRQVISEFATAHTNVIYQWQGKLVMKPFSNLLPDAFGKESLELT